MATWSSGRPRSSLRRLRACSPALNRRFQATTERKARPRSFCRGPLADVPAGDTELGFPRSSPERSQCIGYAVVLWVASCAVGRRADAKCWIVFRMGARPTWYYVRRGASWLQGSKLRVAHYRRASMFCRRSL
ncbi:hypothetical protein PENSPDRAFT_477478 [Peniophora sp. CONT]|nr:hypothetical protein PENSPDRAFT_477478 [Peniophora sp. CONT]